MALKCIEARRADGRARKIAECRSRETWPRYALRRIKYKAKTLGIPFDLTVDDLRLPDLCPVFGVPFVLGDQRRPNIPSVDRVLPELGYVRGNVTIISRRANLIKQDCTNGDDLRAVADYVDATSRRRSASSKRSTKASALETLLA